MREKSWIEGKNLLVEYRYARDRLPALAAELIDLAPDLLIASGPAAALALKSATATIPIVFVAVFDPVGLGLVRSLSHPGGNITGLATSAGVAVAKQIEILRELVPGASKVAILVNPDNPMHRLALAEEIPRTARELGMALPIVEATKAEELDTAFAAQRAVAIIVLGDYLTVFESPRVIALAAEHQLPAIHLFRQFAKGGLVVYGPDLADIWRRAPAISIRSSKAPSLPICR
ncbi:ABC transporter substrate-binding protein [Bradyrhizobium sp. 23AC]